MSCRFVFAILTSLPAIAFGQATSDVLLVVDTENTLFYINDVGDPKKSGTVQKNTFLPPGGWNWAFQQSVIIGDVVAVAGKPARGTFIARETRLNGSADVQPGRVLADTARLGIYDFAIEILQENGTPVGTLFGAFLGAGSPPPGAPSALRAGNFVITGGTGAFVGARGQAATNAYSAMLPPGRDASMTEDPAFRRINGGGYRWRLAIHLVSFPAPEVIAAYHADDFSPVSTSRPARRGEELIIAAKGLGSTAPGLEPGRVFSRDPFQVVTSPVEAVVGDTTVQVGNKLGWPGTRDTYRVDLRLPEGIAPGMVSLKLTAAWIAGSEFMIPVQ